MVEGDSSEGEAGGAQPPLDQNGHREREAASVKPPSSPGPPAAMASSAAPSGAAGQGGLVIGAEAAVEQSAAAAAAAVEQPPAAAGEEDDDNFVSLSARQEQQDPPKLFGEEDAPFADGVQQRQVDVESEIGGPLSPMTTSSIKDDCSTGSDFDWEGASPTEPSSPALRGVHKIAVEVMRRSFGSAEGDPGMCICTACVCLCVLYGRRNNGVRRNCDLCGTPQHQFRPFSCFGTKNTFISLA